MSTKKNANLLAKKIKAILTKYAGDDSDTFADTKILTGDDVHTYLDSTALVAMTYDGAGYDFLSYEGEAVYMGCNALRDMIAEAAHGHGFYMEDQNNWAAAFWPA
jgi:hypothetical protein